MSTCAITGKNDIIWLDALILKKIPQIFYRLDQLARIWLLGGERVLQENNL
jgi:hypothetical protein